MSLRRHRHVVGRRRDVAELIAAVESIRSGRGLVVGLTGEPGIGKSTLVELFLADQRTWGAIVSSRSAAAPSFWPAATPTYPYSTPSTGCSAARPEANARIC